MAWTRNNRIFSFICSTFVNFDKLFKCFGIQASEVTHQTGQPTDDGLNAGFDGNVVNEYHVNVNAEIEERQIEMDQLSSNSLPSQARYQTGQPTVDGLSAGFDGNLANEMHPAGAEIITPQQTEGATIPEPRMDQDENETFKSGVKVAIWATTISASGVTAVWAGFLVNRPNNPMCKFFAKASVVSMSASFISGLLIFILSFIRPKFDATTTMVKIFMFAAIGSMALAVGFGVVFYFENSG